MKRKNHYYVNYTNGFTWIVLLCLASSAISRILLTGLKGSGDILPAAAALIFVYSILRNGKERLYRSAIPVWITLFYFALSIHTADFSRKTVLLCWLSLLIIGALYTAVTSGWYGHPLYLIPLTACLASVAYLKQASTPFDGWNSAIPDILLLAGLLTLAFAIRLYPTEEYHPRWGDRPDGRRVRSIDPMSQMIPYIMVSRNTAVNTFSDSFEISEVDRYVQRKRQEGLTSFGITHVLLASYVRALCRYPALNRFISGQRIYSHGDDIQFCMVVKKEMSIDSPETVIKLHLSPSDTAEDVYRKMNAEVQKVKTSSLDSAFDHTAMAFTLIPGLLLKFTVWVLNVLDYFGLLPKFLLEVSPFHGSVFFTSMGSLGIPPVYHHLYDFGNLPIFVSFGCKRNANELQRDGSVVRKRYMDCKFSMDERITDGFYFAAFFKYYKRIFTHPDVLDNPPEEILADVD